MAGFQCFVNQFETNQTMKTQILEYAWKSLDPKDKTKIHSFLYGNFIEKTFIQVFLEYGEFNEQAVEDYSYRIKEYVETIPKDHRAFFMKVHEFEFTKNAELLKTKAQREYRRRDPKYYYCICGHEYEYSHDYAEWRKCPKCDQNVTKNR